MVENEKNKDGERGIITIKNMTDKYDKIWLNCILMVIGCSFGKSSSEIVGINCSKREGNIRIVFWFKNSKNSLINSSIM